MEGENKQCSENRLSYGLRMVTAYFAFFYAEIIRIAKIASLRTEFNESSVIHFNNYKTIFITML